MYKCPQCQGFGRIFANKGALTFVDCDLCEGTGQISDIKEYWQRMGQDLKDTRLDAGLTLRQAARKYNIDPSNLSKMERGVIKPKAYFNSAPS